MRTQVQGEYRVVRLLILDIIRQVKVLRRPDIFRNIPALPMTRFDVSITSDIIRRVIEDIVDEDLAQELRIDLKSPPQYLLTPQGLEELRHDRTEVAILLDGFQAIRTLFPQSSA